MYPTRSLTDLKSKYKCCMESLTSLCDAKYHQRKGLQEGAMPPTPNQANGLAIGLSQQRDANGVQGQAYQLLPKDCAYPPMNSIVRSFRAVQKPPWLHFIKHLLKMQLGKHGVKGHQRKEPPKNVPAWGPRECQVVTKNPSEVPSTGH